MQVYVRTIANGRGAPALGFLRSTCTGFAMALLLGSPCAIWAQVEPLSAAEQDTVNFAFATQLGSGVYEVSGREIQIYRLPFSWTLSSQADPEIRLLLPVAFGLFDFEPGDLLDEGLPSGLDTLSFTPGIELSFALANDWTLQPAAEIGRAWEQGGEVEATIRTLRLRAVQETERDYGRRRLQATSGYTLVDFEELSDTGDVLYLELAGEARRNIGWQPFSLGLDAGAYALLEWFVDRPDAPVARTTDDDAYASLQLEAGITLGARGDREIWGMPWPRIGVGYRVADGLSTWRIVVGDAF